MRAEIYTELRRRVEADEAAVLATIVAGPGAGHQLLVWGEAGMAGGLGGQPLTAAAGEHARRLLGELRTDRRSFDTGEGAADVFFELQAPRPRLILVGAGHVAIPLVTIARAVGFETVVIDPRSAFASPDRFAHADRLLASWPQEALPEVGIHHATCIALLSHDLKIDLPALRLALRSPAAYIGALGSRKTHDKRLRALREEGFSEEELARIHSPIGLDLGGQRPEEIALATAAQIVAVVHGKGPHGPGGASAGAGGAKPLDDPSGP